MILAQDRPQITGYDQDLWADRLNYADADADGAMSVFTLLRRANLELIDRATAAVGPFVDQHGRLLRFNTFESTALLTVLFQPPILPPFFEFVSEPWLLLPADSTPDDATNQTWTLAAGTVWMRSRFIVPNAPDFTGVRIAAGSFRVDGPLQRVGSTLVLPMIVPWTLDLEAEQPAAADLAAADGSASTITVPRRLVVRSNAEARVTGEA